MAVIMSGMIEKAGTIIIGKGKNNGGKTVI